MAIRRALGISSIAELVGFGLGLVNVIAVSRLLQPAEIGVFSVAVALMGFAHIFREFGVSQYLVQAPHIGREEFRAAFSVTLYASWLIAIALYLLSSPMATLYGNEGIAEILALLSLNFVIMPFGTPLLSMLRRELQFAKLAWINIAGSFVQTAVTIGAAMAGESYLSMAWGAIAMHLSRLLILSFLRPGETLIMPTTKGIREVARFGSFASLASIVGVLGSSAPDLIFGRTLGFVEVAFFSRAVGLNKMFVERINNLVRGVHFPTFAGNVRAGGDAAMLYGQTSNYLVAVTAPALAVFAVLSEPLIVFVFGTQWSRSAPIATIICSGMILVAPYSLYGHSLTATGQVATFMRAEMLSQAVRIAALLTSIWLNLEQVALLLLLAYAVQAAVSQLALKGAFGLTFSSLMKQTWKAIALIPFAAVGPLLVVILAGRMGWAEHFRFAILCVGGTLALLGWLSGVWITGHVMKAEVINVFEKFRGIIRR